MDNIRTAPGRRRPATPPSPAARKPGSRRWWILSAILVALIIIPLVATDMLTDWMWFDSQSLADVYTTRLWLALGVFAAATLLAAVVFWVNWRVAWSLTRPSVVYPGQQETLPRGLASTVIVAASLIMGIFMGLAIASDWPTILLWIHGGTFGQTDPLFHNDIGFYVFALPFYSLLRGWAIGLIIVTAIGVGVIFLVNSGLSRLVQVTPPGNGHSSASARLNINLDSRVSTHLSILGALFLALVAVGYWLGRFDLLYSSRAIAYGAGYTDVSARLPALNIMMVVAAAAAVLLIANIWVRTWKVLAGAVGVWLLALIVVGGIYPAIIQQFVVKPSELEMERPYIVNNIAATRAAFGLDKFREREVPAVSSVTAQQIEENRSVVNDIRLWDYRPLLDTFSQLQEIRSYYAFAGVDIDRYDINGQERQIMLSARELSSGGLSDQVRTWQNQRLVYTHGYGAVAVPVNEIQGEGLPNLLLKNVPPETDVPALKITRPEIYYGELTNDYVFVNSGTPEFDYPLGDTNKFTNYEGKGGVRLSGFFPKLLFALRFGDGNVLLSNYITPDTRVLFHRNITDAVQTLAPFLSYDQDPYLVIADGKLYWIQDAYTTTDRYPYSQPYNDSINYIRNSVKVVIDAYNGTATYYIADSSDPIIQAYRGIFPDLFKDMSEMPASVRAHIRYPEDMLTIQAHMYATFHMTDPQVFYTKEDVWNIPYGGQTQTTEPLEAYYTMMRLPGETKDSFSLILPFTPATKDNMIAWMAAHSDGAEYGTVDVIRYPKQQLVFGPKQIEARIDQDATISEQLTLWSQSGSQVRRGNLLTIPISNSVLYVEPLFLQATNGAFPELKRVIAVTGDKVGFGNDLPSALDSALSGLSLPPTPGTGPGPTGTPQPGTTPTPAPVTGSAAQLTQSALDHYNKAQDALTRADWTTYGSEMTAMKRDLDELARLTGAATPVP